MAVKKVLNQESELGAIEALYQQSIDANPKAVEAYRAAKTASINFLKGQVMKLSEGKANLALIGDIPPSLELNPSRDPA